MILIQSENLKNVVVALLEKGGSNAEEADTVASHHLSVPTYADLTVMG